MGAVVALIAAVWVLAYRFKKMRPILVATTIIIITLTVSSFTVQNKFSDTYQHVIYDQLDLTSTSLEIRISQWKETLAYLADNTITGSGLANYQDALRPYHQQDFIEIFLYPHNIILNFWTELGLLGLVSIIWLLASMMRYLRESLLRPKLNNDLRHMLWAVIAAWVALIVHGFVDVPYFKNDLSVLFMILVGLALVLGNLAANKKMRTVKSVRG